MGKRIICLFIVVVLVVTAFSGLRAMASSLDATKPAVSATKNRISRRPNALASAMFLVLAGVSVSMLFDKKK